MSRWESLAVGAFAVGMASLVSCSIPDASRVTTVLQPNEDLYKAYIDPYLARRCATLDCHGQVGRPLRLYAQLGLRLADPSVTDPIDVTGFRGEPTTDAERHANFQAVIGLQPEVMSQVIGDLGGDPERLLLLLKPLDLIPHKGGTIMTSGGDSGEGYRCIVGWLQGGVDANGDVDPTFVQNCTESTAAP